MSRLSLGRATVVVLLVTVAGLAGQPAATATTSCLGLSVTIEGSAASETILGTPGDDVIDAGLGHDVVRGLGGNDLLCGGGGRDVLEGGAGDDGLDGGGGIDTASFVASAAAVTANLAAGQATGEGADTFTGIENLTGGPRSDRLTGDERVNTVDGGPGNDTCVLADGADTAVNCESANSSYGRDDTVETFRYTVAAGNPVYLRIAGPNGRLTLTGPSGDLISEQPTRYVTDTMTLASPGTYTATVRAFLYQSHAYTVLWTRAPSPQTFAYAIGQVVTQDTPAGAGNLEAPGSADLYTFVGRKGQRVYPQLAPLRFLGQPGFCPDLSMTDPVGTPLLPGAGACGGAGLPATVRLPADGDYTVAVRSGLRGHVGGYSLTLVSAPAPQVFTYAPGTPASSSGTGAGVLERVGSVDEYRFTAAAGRAYLYGWQPHLSITGSDGVQLAPSSAVPSPYRQLTLPADDTYVMRVQSGESATTGAYGLTLYPVPPPQDFAYTLGTEIVDDVPGPGAGHFSGPEAVDRYSFTATAGERLLVRSADPTLPWTLRDPAGRATARTGNVLYTPARTGRHVLDVGPASPSWPELHYTLRVDRVPAPDRFALSRPVSVSDGLPEAGAGRIEVPGASDEYTFTTPGGGERVLVDWVTGARPLRWQIFGPEGFPYTSAMSSAAGDQVVTFWNPGVHTMRVTSVTRTEWWTGPYEFRLS